jgi:hypothetical protein
MDTEEKKDKTDKAECADFISSFGDCQEMFEKMEGCCTDLNCSTNCSTMMGGMMKEMMKKCCETKVKDAK